MERTATRWERGAIIGLWTVILLFLALFAWRFADERLYADSGYYLLRTIHEGSFHIEHGRWVLVLAEWLPLLGSKLGLDMRGIIVLHSLSNVVFVLLGSLFAWSVLKDARAAAALITTQLIGLTHGLFCPVFELYYGVGLVVLFVATLMNEELEGRTRTILACLLFIAALSSHPMAWSLLAGSILLLDHRQGRPLIIPLGVVVIVFAAVRFSTMSEYESAQLAFVQRLASPKLVLGLFAPDVLLDQLRRVVQHYPDVLILVSFNVVALWHGRQRRMLLVFAVGVLVLYTLIGLYLPDPTHDRYREQVDFGVAAWTLLVLFFRVWPLANWRPVLLVVLVLCCAYRMVEAERIAPSYTKRTAWQKDLVAQARSQGSHKAIADPGGIAFGTVDDRVAPYWSTGVETLLLSAKDGPYKVVSVITVDDAQCTGAMEDVDKVVLRCGDVLPDGYLDPRWAVLPQGKYAKLQGSRDPAQDFSPGQIANAHPSRGRRRHSRAVPASPSRPSAR